MKILSTVLAAIGCATVGAGIVYRFQTTKEQRTSHFYKVRNGAVALVAGSKNYVRQLFSKTPSLETAVP